MAGGKTDIIGEIVLKYLRDETYQNMPSLTLARAIKTHHPMDFKDAEHARKIIRYYRKAYGKVGKKSRKGKEEFPNLGKLNPWTLPEEESIENVPIKLEGSEFGIISDLHIPNHRNQPIQIALNSFGNCDHIVINGDLLDNTPFSRHAPIHNRPLPADVRTWFDKTEYFLEYLRERFPNANITWLEGNHDKWYRRWLLQHAAELSDDPYFDLQQRLHLSEYGITYLQEDKFGMMGKLAICHGHQILRGFFAPVNAARGVYLKVKRSMMVGHVHVESSHTETDLHGEIVTTFSTGSLCTLTPEYQPFGGKACHGYARVLVDTDGTFQVINKRIHRGKEL